MEKWNALSQGKKRGIIAAAVIVLMLCIIGGVNYYRHTPTYSLKIIQQSIQEHDWNKFQTYVDTESLYGHLYDDFIDAALEESAPKDKSMQPLVKTFAMALKPSFVSTLNDMTEDYVKTGDFKADDNSKKKDDGSQLATNVQKDMPVQNSEFKDAKTIKKEGNAAVVALVFHDNQLDQDFTIELQMEKLADSTWKVSKINNLKEYLSKQKEAQKNKLAEVNQPMRDEIDSIIQVNNGAVTFKVVKMNPFSHRLNVSFPVTVSGDKEISMLHGYGRIMDSDGNDVKKLNLKLDWTKKKDKSAIFYHVNLNDFKDEDKEIIDANAHGLRGELVITGIDYADGTSVSLKKSLNE